MRKNPHIGPSVDEYIAQRGLQDMVQAMTAKGRIAYRIQEQMQQQGVTKTELAQRMGTSRAVVHRLLRVDDLGLRLDTLVRACSALGLELDFGAMLRAAGAPDAVTATATQEASAPARKKPARPAAPRRVLAARKSAALPA